VCRCPLGGARACEEHEGLDGRGQCRPESRHAFRGKGAGRVTGDRVWAPRARPVRTRAVWPAMMPIVMGCPTAAAPASKGSCRRAVPTRTLASASVA
jgi:hypothetical protein